MNDLAAARPDPRQTVAIKMQTIGHLCGRRHRSRSGASSVALVLSLLTFPCARGLSIEQNRGVSLQPLAGNEPTSSVLSSSSLSSERQKQLHQPEQWVRPADSRRPIWALAHMVNSIKELDYRLGKGANAIESDVTFARTGEPLYTYHGPPCDCWRHCHQHELFTDYLEYVRKISIERRPPAGIGQNLSLLFLDLKLETLSQSAKVVAGRELAKAVLFHLYNWPSSQSGPEDDANFSLILSVNHVNDLDLVNNFIHTLEISNASQLLKRHIGFDVGMNDELQLIESMWRRFDNSLNLWQGDGYTNCFSPFYNLERLSRALAKRDQPRGYPAKVYHWTIDLHDRMRESLLLGVDAVMTNHPERLLAVLQEPEIAHDFRLATRQDEPFAKLTRRLVSRNGETARYQRSANTNSGGFIGNLVDILSSWYHYIREIPFLSFPTTLMSSSSSSSKSSHVTANNSQKRGATIQLMPVQLHNEPVYKTLEMNTSGSPVSLSEALDRSLVQPAGEANNSTTAAESDNNETLPAYEGPKWYVSLISNVLLSAVKILLPVA